VRSIGVARADRSSTTRVVVVVRRRSSSFDRSTRKERRANDGVGTLTRDRDRARADTRDAEEAPSERTE